MIKNKFKTVQELLAKPERWTKGWFARKSNGETIDAKSEAACFFCLSGAVFRVYGPGVKSDKIILKIRRYLKLEIPVWNDDKKRTHAEVLNLCRKLKI